MSECEKPDCHDSYFPYCYGNAQLKSILDNLCKKNQSDLAGRIKKFQQITSIKCFRNTSIHCCGYLEDDWTERLHICLGLNRIDSELTADLRGRRVQNTWSQRLPKGIDSRSLLFQGSPDLIINKVKGSQKEGMCTVNKDDDDD